MQLYSLIGNLGADAKIVDNNGKPFISFNVADTDRWKDEAGNVHESTTWVQCTLNGGAADNKVFEFLKAGTKVFVMGRMRTRVYSSEKERRMVAGVNLYVMQIELVGGSSDVVPRTLIDPNTGALVKVQKSFWIADDDLKVLTSDKLVDKSGNFYGIVDNRWVTPFDASAPVEQQSNNENQSQDDAPFTGDDSGQIVNSK